MLYALLGLVAALLVRALLHRLPGPRHRAMIAGLVERLDLTRHHQAERARAALSTPAAAASSATT